MTREECWLCDLLPQACMNPAQKRAIERAYLPLVDENCLPLPTIATVPGVFAGDARRREILDEIEESRSQILILLGDQPIKWFLRHYEPRWQKLSDFGTTPESYGELHQTVLDGMEIRVLPLAHPRQVARLGRSSERWYSLHQAWLQKAAGRKDSII